MLFVLSPAWANAGAEVEPQPTLEVSALISRDLALSGAGYRVRSPVLVDNFLGRYQIETDWGLIEARGSELLAIRIGEVAAIARLDTMRKSDVFAEALVDSAKATGNSVVRVVTNPVDTVKGLPSGIGRIFTRSAGTISGVARKVADTARGDDDGAKGPGGAPDFAKEAIGLNKARRALAKSLGIDPYTGNPILQERLEELAWAAMAGGMTMSMVSSAAGPALSVVTRVDGLVWDQTPVEIRQTLEKQLLAQGFAEIPVRGFLRNGWFTPTLQVALVKALDKFAKVEGAVGVLELASRIESEAHARFLIRQLEMLGAAAEPEDPVAGLVQLDAMIAARTAGGKSLVAMPVDFIGWTSEVLEIDSDPVPSGGAGAIVVSGGVSERARKELLSRGWKVLPHQTMGMEYAY